MDRVFDERREKALQRRTVPRGCHGHFRDLRVKMDLLCRCHGSNASDGIVKRTPEIDSGHFQTVYFGVGAGQCERDNTFLRFASPTLDSSVYDFSRAGLLLGATAVQECVMSPRSMTSASEGTAPPMDSILFPRTTITAEDWTMQILGAINLILRWYE
ncbi:MAG TPA: hypothetical protein VNN25_07270 [Thermoanaerobaculia bacterium]|nr:hypothetical protein [Thermoanaerobaculia bacterium]